MLPGFQYFPEGQIIGFALIFLRIVAFVVAWPIFGTQSVPSPVKVLLALVLTVAMFPVVSFTNVDLVRISEEIIFLAGREIFLGLVMGFFLRMFFYTISVAGELIGVSMSLSAAQLFNPSLGSQGNVVEQFQLALATLVLLAINGHHFFISGLAKSFELLPVSAMGLNYQGFAQIGAISQEVLIIGVKMAAPILIAIFLTNLSMGIIGRAVPQVNVFVTSLQVTVMVGIAILIVSMPLLVGEMNGLMELVSTRFFSMVKTL